MSLVHKYSVMISSLLLAVALAGCSSGSVDTIVKDTEKATIGQGSGSGVTTTRTESVKADEFDSIVVDAEAMGIIVEPAAGNSAEIELVTDQAVEKQITFDAQVKDRELRVNVHEDKKWNANKSGRGERKLVIKLPGKAYEHCSVSTAFGTVKASGIQAKSFDIEVNAGSIETSGIIGEMKLHVTTGEIKVDGYKMDHNLTAQSEVGNIHITLDESPAAGSVNLHSKVGSVTAAVDHITYDVDSANRKEGAFGPGGSSLEADVEVGSIQVVMAR
ncbi:DUF4097 family beta strand repeat-containing protein [Paenibacillus kobensis]|uniref:DUF4097 family beta strand repeat-containing protein n=1 Tax=Paenibacillus kobensis TaxID=59841 RepID=UPI0013E348F1|nr:DUF4097 family beta strand repeat-containing protein [Paenibacillus kobensis]